MKKSIYLLWSTLLFLLSSCFAPLNSVYDTAKLLEKKETRISANYSKYYGSEEFLSDFVNLNDNFGFSLGYGLSDKFNISCRYEYLKIKLGSIEIFNETVEMDNDLNYFEIGCKIRLIKDKLALGIPVGLYNWEGTSFISIDPRLYFTIRKSDKFDFSVIPKTHIFIDDGVNLLPGLSLGIGLSNNLDKWAIRPEVGFDGYLNFGIGVNYNFNKK